MQTKLDTAELAPSADDLQDIIRASLDYIEAWYTGDAERMKACLHPDLAKRSVWKDVASGARVLRNTTAQRMYELTQEGGGSDVPEADKVHEVTILDAFRNIASVKVVSEYVDYLHVARFDERWLIVSVLWDFRGGDSPRSLPS
jgi:hypothetical protein